MGAAAEEWGDYTSTCVRFRGQEIEVISDHPAPVLFELLHGGRAFIDQRTINERALATAEHIIMVCAGTDWELADQILAAEEEAHDKGITIAQALKNRGVPRKSSRWLTHEDQMAARRVVHDDPYHTRVRELEEQLGSIHQVGIELQQQHVDPLYSLVRTMIEADKALRPDVAAQVRRALVSFQNWRQHALDYLNLRYRIRGFSRFLLDWKPNWADLNDSI